MDCIVSKTQSSLSSPAKAADGGDKVNEKVSTCPYLKLISVKGGDGSESLDRDTILRRIHHHRVRTAFRSMLTGGGRRTYSDTDEHEWVQLMGDAFSP